MIVFANYYSENGKFNSRQMQEYRLLCRKELGIKTINLDKEIHFINCIGKNSSPKNN